MNVSLFAIDFNGFTANGNAQNSMISGKSRLRQRRGQIAGLHNFGRTCFLNTLLQALAACPQFIAWLQLHGASDKKSLIGSLLNTLEGKSRISHQFITVDR